MTFENLKKEVRKRKGWTAPGIEGIQNYWWKTFESARKALSRPFIKLTENNHMIPMWWPSGRRISRTRPSLYSFLVVSYRKGNLLTASIRFSFVKFIAAILSIIWTLSIVLMRLDASKLNMFNFAA